MLHFQTVNPAESVQGPQLVQRIGLRLRRRNSHVSSAESHKVRISGMCSHPDPRLFRHGESLIHDNGIGSVIAAGYVG